MLEQGGAQSWVPRNDEPWPGLVFSCSGHQKPRSLLADEELIGVVAGSAEPSGELHGSNLVENKQTNKSFNGPIKNNWCCSCGLSVIVVFLLVTVQLSRPGDTKDSDILLAVGQNGLALLSAGTDHCVLLRARWDKGLAQELMDVWRAAQVCQGHEWLEIKRQVLLYEK